MKHTKCGGKFELKKKEECKLTYVCKRCEERFTVYRKKK